jgi:hypothetical protein
MPCGVYTETDIPAADLDEVLAGIALDSPISVTKTQQPDGTWTVVATYPPCPPGQPQSTTKEHGT